MEHAQRKFVGEEKVLGVTPPCMCVHVGGSAGRVQGTMLLLFFNMPSSCVCVCGELMLQLQVAYADVCEVSRARCRRKRGTV